jgi:hypothetical protein
MREYTREIEYLYNMKKIYKSKGLYPTYFRGWAEEILHLVDNHMALSNLLTNMGYRGKLIDKLTEFYKEE